MPDTNAKIILHRAMAEIPATAWDRLVAPEAVSGRPRDPFTTHRFLLALEQSGSVGEGTGWQSHPLALWQGGQLLAAMPLYVKSHSQGEYIFDHGWAEAYGRAGGEYYPKLQVAVPFTPVTGQRIFGPEPAQDALLQAAMSIAQDHGLSSLHLTFCSAEEIARFGGKHGLLARIGQQFHWHNLGYADFEGFLAQLSSRKRKAIRKERKQAQSHGLDIRALSGDQIEPAHWDAFWNFYQDTGSRKWGRPYLTRAAFDQFHATMREDILLVMAFDGEIAVAGALNFIGRDTLFGRYWGAVRDYPCLHFELCYYQAIDWAIAQGLSRVEAGAQGEHKLARGYLPNPVHSLHWIAHSGLRAAVAQYLEAEEQAVQEDIEVLTAFGPFKRGAQDQAD